MNGSEDGGGGDEHGHAEHRRASLVPTCAPQGYFPDALKETTMKAYEGAGLGDIFSAKAEMINGRAAMLGMAVFIATATIF